MIKAKKIQVEDIKRIGKDGSITIELPNYLACVSAKNLVGYVKKAYPREDGEIYYCRISGTTITIGVSKPEDLTRRRKSVGDDGCNK